MARKAHSCGCGNAICVCSLPRVGLGNGQLKRPLDGMPSAPLARLDNLPAPLARAPSLSQRLLARTSSGGALAAGGSDGPPLPPPPLPASKLARQDGGPRPTTFFDVATRLPVLSDAEQAAQATMHAVRACTPLPSRLPRQRRCGCGCRLSVFNGALSAATHASAAARAGASRHAVAHSRRYLPPRRAAARARAQPAASRRGSRSRRCGAARRCDSCARCHAADVGYAALGLVAQNRGALHVKHAVRLGDGAACGALRRRPCRLPRGRGALRPGGAPRARAAHLVRHEIHARALRHL